MQAATSASPVAVRVALSRGVPVEVLDKGPEVKTLRLTIPEGLTLPQIAAREQAAVLVPRLALAADRTAGDPPRRPR